MPQGTKRAVSELSNGNSSGRRSPSSLDSSEDGRNEDVLRAKDLYNQVLELAQCLPRFWQEPEVKFHYDELLVSHQALCLLHQRRYRGNERGDSIDTDEFYKMKTRRAAVEIAVAQLREWDANFVKWGAVGSR